MATITYDKIRVLLIDDYPSSLEIEDEYEGRKCAFPVIYDPRIPELESYFELRWIATATEAREFRDLTSAVALRNPRALDQEGWVPEILCFDYALTKDQRPLVDREFPSHLLRET